MGASYSVKHDNGGRPSKRLEHVDNLGSIPCLRAAANCVAQTMLLVCPQEPVRVLGGRVRVRTDNLREIVNSGGYVRRGAVLKDGQQKTTSPHEAALGISVIAGRRIVIPSYFIACIKLML